MARCSFAQWRGPADSNYRSGGVVRPLRGCVLHVIVGSLAAADSVFHRSGWNASAHFGVGFDGTVFQWVDTDDRAWAEGAGNPEWISIETEGQPSQPLTNAQVASVARLFAWGQIHGPYPYEVTNSPSGRGLGTHSMGGSAWGGHECPGAIRAAQRQLVLDVARGAPAPVPTPVPVPQEEDVRIPHPDGNSRTDPDGNPATKRPPNAPYERGTLGLFGRGRGKVTCEEYPKTSSGAVCRIVIGSPAGWRGAEVWIGAKSFDFAYDESKGDKEIAVTVYGLTAGDVGVAVKADA